MEAVVKYFSRLMVALSVLLNVILGGPNNQTFSARNYQWMRDGRLHLVFWIDLVLGKGHCMECWVYWKVRKEW